MTGLPFDPNVMDRERTYMLSQQNLPFKQIVKQGKSYHIGKHCLIVSTMFQTFIIMKLTYFRCLSRLFINRFATATSDAPSRATTP
jgi:hypothetical protein